MRNLDKLFSPDSIAVVGATEARLKWGSFVATNIIDGGFNGRIYPVSQTHETVYGLKAYKSLAAIPGHVDLAFIATPARTVMDVLKDCKKKRIDNIVIISSGFSETGSEGTILEREIIEFAEKHSLNIVGPNTMGISNLHKNLHGTGAHPRPTVGGISIIAQSGNVGNQIMLWAELQNIGIGKFVGSGNEAVLRVEDFLEYFNEDEETTVILMYLEGVDDGRRFLEIAKEICFRKPVIAIKAGRTEGGGRAAQSHTGAMAGSFRVFESGMKQAGITIAMNPTELLELAAVFDGVPLPKGNRVGIITLGGGWGVIAADECEERGLQLPQLPERIRQLFDSRLPSFWSKANPVDLVGQPDHQLFQEAIEVMVASEAFDAVIVLGLIGATKFGLRPVKAAHRLGFLPDDEFAQYDRMAREVNTNILDTILATMDKYDKPIYPVSLASFPDDEMIYTRPGSKYKAIVYKTPEMAALCLSRQYLYSKYLSTRKRGRN